MKDKILEKAFTVMSKLPSVLIGTNILLAISNDGKKYAIYTMNKGVTIITNGLEYKSVDEITSNTSQYIIQSDIIMKSPQSGISNIDIRNINNKYVIGIEYGDGIRLTTSIIQSRSTSQIKNLSAALNAISKFNSKKNSTIKIDYDLLHRHAGITRIISSKSGMVIGNNSIALVRKGNYSTMIIDNEMVIDAIKAMTSISKDTVNVLIDDKNVLSGKEVDEVCIYNIIGNAKKFDNNNIVNIVDNAIKSAIDDNGELIIRKEIKELIPSTRKIVSRSGKIANNVIITVFSNKIVLDIRDSSTRITSEIEVDTGIKKDEKVMFTIPINVVKFINRDETVKRIKIGKAKKWHTATLDIDSGIITYVTNYAKSKISKK